METKASIHIERLRKTHRDTDTRVETAKETGGQTDRPRRFKK